MSYLFEMDDTEVWGPGNLTAELYLGMVEPVAKLLDRPTGLTMKPGGSWYDVDRIAYPGLVTEMLRRFVAGGNWQYRIMLGGLLAVSIAILDRAGIEIETRTEAERKAVDDLREACF